MLVLLQHFRQLILWDVDETILTSLTANTWQGVTKEDLEKAGASLQAAAASAVVIEEPAPVPVTSTVDRLSTSLQDHRSMSLTDEVRWSFECLISFVWRV